MAELLLSYYGDDFTGSTDVMEALAANGVKTVLFTRPPSKQELERFSDFRAVGLAGTSRSQNPDWMELNLTPAFTWLKGLNARFCHYKVCSTFDSSPRLGSIGKAIDIGRKVFGADVVPLIVGAPQLKRYTAFGHLFAAYQGKVYRIDRHPVMSRHPVTPMDEADLRLHLGRQTDCPVMLATDSEGRSGIWLYDVMDLESQRQAGVELFRLAEDRNLFVAGSSGVEYALMAALTGMSGAPARTKFEALPPVQRILVVSGSCSPTTDRQIEHALGNGFSGIAADPEELAASGDAAIDRICREAAGVLANDRSVIVHTARGPQSDRGAALDAIGGGRHLVGQALGRITRRLIAETGLTRVVLAGGDSSSHALGELDIFALTTRMPLKSSPGSPLCSVHSNVPALDGLELAMKGGQIGKDNYFAAMRDGLVDD
jgi:3-oxoisoapionate kinase